MLVSAKQLKKETNQAPGTEEVSQAVGEAPAVEAAPASSKDKGLLETITKGNILGSNVNLEKRKEAISAKGFEPTEFAYERAIGRNDSLYSNFTELIAVTKRKVGRIVIIEDGKRTGYATGFMVSKKLLLTNWHVFRSKDMAEESEVHFFYEYDMQGYPVSPTIFKLDTAAFFNDEELDYCFVGVKPTDVTGKVSLESIGYLYLDKTLGKIGDKNVEKLNIIHHPQGDYKQISIRENTFTDIAATMIFYTTDTAQGSSGSPVFNDQWQVVGLHHKSIAKMTADGRNYLDKDDMIIPVVGDKIDVTRVVWLQNEGIRISVILNHLFKSHPNNEWIATLNVPPAKETLSFSVDKKQTGLTTDTSGNNIHINVPLDALGADNSIEISVSNRAVDLVSHAPAKGLPAVSASGMNELFLEVAKVEKEQGVDFRPCKGYDPMFLGVEIRLPQPKKAIKKEIARLKDNSMELKYFSYSVFFNAVTKMPLLSAVNVEGNPAKRLDDSKRSDDWLRDSRIDSECQLTDKFYEKSNFDKGHMSRFEDANWADTEADALSKGIFTCFYTNACPQVGDLNRSGGLWGKLEKAVLEKGVKKQAGKQTRMTVFNGPIFNKDKDRIFKGVRIPMEFYKIIVWLADNGKPKATAFKLSQETLVDEIDFDERMRLVEEALDIDQVALFKSYQCSLKSLGTLTNIDFKHLEKFDTFKAKAGGQETLLVGTESITL